MRFQMARWICNALLPGRVLDYESGVPWVTHACYLSHDLTYSYYVRSLLGTTSQSIHSLYLVPALVTVATSI